MITNENKKLAQWAMEFALKNGCQASRVSIYNGSSSSFEIRDMKMDRLQQASENSLVIHLFVDGRFGSFSTNRLDKKELESFIRNGIASTRFLAEVETESMFESMFAGWFENQDANYNEFVKALLKGNLKEMNIYMNDVALATFSSFDTGRRPSAKSQPERFYHGFVLGLLSDLREQYQIRSNRESGYGRYDIMLVPEEKNDNAIVMEFKVHEPDEETSLQDTVQSALKQIQEKNYDAELLAQDIPTDRIRHYGFAFEGKKVLIGTDA